MQIVESLLASALTLFGFALFAFFLFYFFPVLLPVLLLVMVYQAFKWAKQKQNRKQLPNYQNYGYQAKGVAEDHTDTPLSFEPKH